MTFASVAQAKWTSAPASAWRAGPVPIVMAIVRALPRAVTALLIAAPGILEPERTQGRRPLDSSQELVGNRPWAPAGLCRSRVSASVSSAGSSIVQAAVEPSEALPTARRALRVTQGRRGSWHRVNAT